MTEDVARPTTTPAGTAGTPDPRPGGVPGVLLAWARRVVFWICDAPTSVNDTSTTYRTMTTPGVDRA